MKIPVFLYSFHISPNDTLKHAFLFQISEICNHTSSNDNDVDATDIHVNNSNNDYIKTLTIKLMIVMMLINENYNNNIINNNSNSYNKMMILIADSNKFVVVNFAFYQSVLNDNIIHVNA